MKKIFFTVTAIFCLTIVGFSQGVKSTVSGTVSDQNGAVIANATVTLIGSSGGRQTSVTNGEGQFSFANVMSGIYSVRAEANGFQPTMRENFDVNSAKATVDFRLEPGGVAANVTVNAEKREEEISKVATTVNVITDRQVEQAGLNRFKDIQTSVPNLHLTNTGGRATFGYVSMRGFINAPVSIDSSVAVYVDGIPVNDFFSYTQTTLFDVDQIEVVKGPQSTLYGVNSQAGVISVNSRRPTNDLRYTFGGGIGSFKTFDGNFGVSGPIVKDKLFVSFSGQIDGRGGFIRNVVTGKRYDNEFGFSGRLRLIWKPADNWEIGLTASGSRIDDNGGYIYLPTDIAAFNTLPGLGTRRVGNFEQALDYDGFNRSTINQQSIQVTRYGQKVNFTYLGGRRENDQIYAFDADLTPTRFYLGTALGHFKDIYQEARLQSPNSDSKFNWLAGFVFNENYRELATEVQAFAGNNFGLPPGTYRFSDSRQNSKNYGVFGQGTYRALNRKLGLTFGLRYDRVRRDFKRLPTAFGFALNRDFDESIWLPKFTVDYRLGENNLIYATAGKGWKAGGYNPNADTVANSLYRRETNWSYEAGVKSKFLNNRAYFNAAYFYNDISGYHESVYYPGSFAANVGNAEKVSSYGVDLEGAFSPVNGLRFDGNLGLVNSKYVKYTYNIPLNFNLDGVRVRQVPNADYSLGTEYRFLKTYFARGEVNGVGEFTEYILNAFVGSRRDFSFGKYAVVNLRGGYEGERWSVIGYVNNIADKNYFTNTETGFVGLSGYTEPLGVVGARRVVGVRLRYRFGK